MRVRRRGIARRLAGVGAVVLATAGVVVLGGFTGPTAAAPPPTGVVVSASPTGDLTDGQRITVNIKAPSDVFISTGNVKQCRLGATYEQPSDLLPNRGNCPGRVLSTSSDLGQRREFAYFYLSRQPSGLDIDFRVGAGTAEWDITSTQRGSLTCGPDDPCALVVELKIGTSFYYWTTRLDFVESDPLAGCGGPAPGVLASAGSDEISDAWARWTRAFCSRPGGQGAVSSASFGGGEGPAVSGFSSGLNDIAYTAAGFNPDVGLTPAGSPTRDAVAVPVAVNAAVLAAGNGYTLIADGNEVGKAVYPTLRFTPQELAAFTGGGVAWVTNGNNSYLAPIYERNPILTSAFVVVDLATKTLAQSTTLSSHYFLTRYVRERAPAHFVDPSGVEPVERVPTSTFALVTPAYSAALELVTGRPTMLRINERAYIEPSQGPIWTITDRATAKALRMTPVALEDQPGVFVEPTRASMTAALARMTADERGLLVPNLSPPTAPAEVSAAADEAPYPLTYVVYALVPAEPLYDEACTPRTDSQQILAEWLTYITTDGQDLLPDGLMPLTPELRATAAAAIGEVGTAPVTGACANVATAPPSSPSSPSSPAAAPSASAAPRTTVNRAVGTPAAAAPAAGSTAAANAVRNDETLAAVPVLSTRRLPETGAAVIAILGIALVSSLGVFMTSQLARGGSALGGEGGFVNLGDRRSVVGIVLLWLGIVVAGTALVVYQLGPLTQQRAQSGLFDEYRQELRTAKFAGEGLPGTVDAAAEVPPEIGAPVGILESNRLGLQEVVVEGMGPGQTAQAPGHVPGTAGLGQPGNAVVVGRRNAYGGPFRNLEDLRRGDRIVTATTQGQSVYVVRSVKERPYRQGLLRPTDDDRLTLVTSGSAQPRNAEQAVVVVAEMRDLPFAPTVQGARTGDQTSLSGQSSWSAILIAFVLYGAVLAGSVLAYRRFRFPIAYVLTIAPILAVTVVLGESLSTLLPSWS